MELASVLVIPHCPSSAWKLFGNHRLMSSAGACVQSVQFICIPICHYCCLIHTYIQYECATCVCEGKFWFWLSQSTIYLVEHTFFFFLLLLLLVVVVLLLLLLGTNMMGRELALFIGNMIPKISNMHRWIQKLKRFASWWYILVASIVLWYKGTSTIACIKHGINDEFFYGTRNLMMIAPPFPKKHVILRFKIFVQKHGVLLQRLSSVLCLGHIYMSSIS
jgi:hypothetical protein